MDRRSLSTSAAVFLTTVMFAASPADAVAGNSLATPITGRQVHELWPIEIEAEIVKVGATPQEIRSARLRAGIVPLRSDPVQVADGHHMQFSSVVRTPRGVRRFELRLVPRHHPDAVELEYDLEVSDADYEEIHVGHYLLHRLRMGPQLRLGEELLKIARSDIVETRGERFVQRFRIGADAYEIRIHARSLRG
jgi:hypothetical protein